jgi:hypothetical protein
MDPANRPPAPPADDHLLEDLAAITGLLNPERIWQQEQQLDDLSEGRADEGPLPAQSAPDAAAAE